jgi:predicted DNA-binding protein
MARGDPLQHMSIRIPPALLERCYALAEADGRSFNNWVTATLERVVAEAEREAEPPKSRSVRTP